MSQLPEQALSSLPIWLNILAKIFTPNRVTLVGAGNGSGPLVQWLMSQDVAEVTLFEADTNSFAQLVKRAGQIPGWLSRQELVVPGMSTDEVHNFYRYQLASESGLLDLGDLQALWPNLQMHSQQTMQGIDLAGLQPAGWLMLDCLPAAHLLQEADLQHTQVILGRVVLSEAHNSGSSLADLHTHLAPQGYQLAACFAERNTALGKALWMRDSASQLTQISRKLQSELEQAKAQAQQQLSQTKTELQAKLETETKARQAAETQAKTLEAQKAEVLAQKDDLAKAQEQTGTQIKALQSELEQSKAQTVKEYETLKKEKEVLDKDKQAAGTKSAALQKQVNELSAKLSIVDGQNKNLLLVQDALKNEILKAEAQIELIKDLMKNKAIHG